MTVVTPSVIAAIQAKTDFADLAAFANGYSAAASGPNAVLYSGAPGSQLRTTLGVISNGVLSGLVTAQDALTGVNAVLANPKLNNLAPDPTVTNVVTQPATVKVFGQSGAAVATLALAGPQAGEMAQ